jgi:hypothetical protein
MLPRLRSACLALGLRAVRDHELQLGKGDRGYRDLAVLAALAALEHGFVPGPRVDHPGAGVGVEQVAHADAMRRAVSAVAPAARA